MRKICSSVLLLSDNDDFISTYKDLALECDVQLYVESDFSTARRVHEDRIICGSKYLSKIDSCYYDKVVVILKSNENYFDFVQVGINDFIFDHKNKKELAFAFTKQAKEYVRANANVRGVKNLLEAAETGEYIKGDYAFYFDKGKFFYKGEGIYLSRCYQYYLIEWLLKGNKDVKKRPYLCNMRKLFGKEFLSDVDRVGNLVE